MFPTRPILLASLLFAASADAGGFVENQGQVPHSAVHAIASDGLTDVYLTDDGLTLDLRHRGLDDAISGHAIKLALSGRRGANPVVRYESPRPERISVFKGKDRDKWVQGARAYDVVVVEDAWPGVDLRLVVRDGGLAYQLVSASAEALANARLEASGEDRRLDLGADIHLETSIDQTVVWRQSGDDSGEFVWNESRYLRPAEPGFPGYWGTFIGSSNYDDEARIEIADNGDVIIAGMSIGGNYPYAGGAYDGSDNDSGAWDGVVRSLSADGSTLIWSTYIGGSANDFLQYLMLDPSGSVWAFGASESNDFPDTFGAYEQDYQGLYDGVITRFSSDGVLLEFATYVGGSGNDYVTDAELEPSGDLVFVLETGSGGLGPFPLAYQPNYAGSGDAFIGRLSASGSMLLHGSYLGGSGADGAYGLALDGTGGAVVTGITYSSDFPTTPGAFQEEFAGGVSDGIVARLDATFESLAWSTHLGGATDDEFLRGAEATGDGGVLIFGLTASPDFPVTAGTVQPYFGGVQDLSLTRFDITTGQPEWSTFIGGSDIEYSFTVRSLPDGQIAVTGYTDSADYPTTLDGAAGTYAGGRDGILSILSADGESLLSSTYIGGAQRDIVFGVAFDADRVFISGATQSTDFPVTAGTYSQSHAGVEDIFIASWLLDLAPGLAIQSVDDVANDQGRRVRLTFFASVDDNPFDSLPIEEYVISRRIDPLPGERTGEDWDVVAHVPALGQDVYNVIVPTLADSTEADGVHLSTFRVRGNTADPAIFVTSDPVAGYSIDNLAPGVPAGFRETAVDMLTWEESRAADFEYFTVYASNSTELDGSESLVAYTTGTDLDASGMAATDYYLLSATDHSGNEGAVAVWSRGAASAGSTPAVVRPDLAVSPNPFNPATTISYSVPVTGEATLRVYDGTGRVVETLFENQYLSADQYELRYQPTFESGVYFIGLTVAGQTHMQKMVLLK